MPTLHHDRRRVRRVLNPPAREVNARTGKSLRENMIFDPSLITFYEDKKKLRTGNISAGFFRDTQRLHVWVMARACIHPAEDLHRRPRSLDVSFF